MSSKRFFQRCGIGIVAVALIYGTTSCSKSNQTIEAIAVTGASFSKNYLAIAGSGLALVNSLTLTQNASALPFTLISQTDSLLTASLNASANVTASQPLQLVLKSIKAQSTTTLTIDLSGTTAVNFTSTGITDQATATVLTLSAAGNVGIGTTSPSASLDVHGHVANSGTDATVGTCGTSPTISGNDTRGIVTLGTGSPIACTVTFASAFATAPVCTITPYGGLPGAIQWYVATTSATLVMNFSAAPTTSQQFAYSCMQ